MRAFIDSILSKVAIIFIIFFACLYFLKCYLNVSNEKFLSSLGKVIDIGTLECVKKEIAKLYEYKNSYEKFLNKAEAEKDYNKID